MGKIGLRNVGNVGKDMILKNRKKGFLLWKKL